MPSIPITVRARNGAESRVFFLTTGRIPSLNLTGQDIAECINAHLPPRYHIKPRSRLLARLGGRTPYRAGSILAVGAAQEALKDSPIRPATPAELIAYMRRVDTKIPRVSFGVSRLFEGVKPWEEERHNTSNAAGLILYDTKSVNSRLAEQLEQALDRHGLLAEYPFLVWGFGIEPDPYTPYGIRFTITPETRTLTAPAFADPGNGSADFYTLRDISLEELVTEGRLVSTPVRESPAQLKVHVVPGGLRVLRRHKNTLQASEYKLDFGGFSGRLLMAYR